MKQIRWAIALFLISTLATAGATRILDGAQITNGAATLTLPTSTDTLVGRDTTDTFTNKSFNQSITSVLGLDLTLATNNSAVVDANPTDGVSIVSGNKTAGTGNSGPISIQTGTSAGGARGGITIDGSSVDFPAFAKFENSQLLSTSWAADFPALVIDGTSTAGLAAFGAGIILKGDGTQTSLFFGTQDVTSGANATADIYNYTGKQSGTGASGSYYIQTGDAVAGNTGLINLYTSNAPGGNSGNIQMTIGTASGTPGVFKFLRGTSNPSIGDVWTASATDGTGYWATPAAPAPAISGSTGTPTAITAAGGITFSGSNYSNIYFIQGSGGPVDITASPQISAGTSVGQKLTLIGQSDTNTVKLDHGTGLSLNGSAVLAKDSAIDLLWDGTVWTEIARR